MKGQHQKQRTKSRIWRYNHFQNAQGYVKLYMQNTLRPDERKAYSDVPVSKSIRSYAVKLRTTENKFVWEMKKKDGAA